MQSYNDYKNSVRRHHQSFTGVSHAASPIIPFDIIARESLQLTLPGGNGCSVEINLRKEFVHSRRTVSSRQASFPRKVSFLPFHLIPSCSILTLHAFRLRGMVVLKGRRPEGATDDYDTDDDAANDDMTDQQSVVTAVTVKTSVASISSSVSSGRPCVTLLVHLAYIDDSIYREEYQLQLSKSLQNWQS